MLTFSIKIKVQQNISLYKVASSLKLKWCVLNIFSKI